MQSRNSHIGKYTEEFCIRLLSSILVNTEYYPVRNVICEEIGLTKHSGADIAICKSKGRYKKAKDIICIIEVKMSLVWNWELHSDARLELYSDYNKHSAIPGLLRSDSMLKAIGKAAVIRTTNIESNTIPIIVLTNTPINESYYNKVDLLKQSGIIQGFWSINPNLNPNDPKNMKSTEQRGFIRIDSVLELKRLLLKNIHSSRVFFSSFSEMKDIGRAIIKTTDFNELDKKARIFIEYLQKHVRKIS